MSCVNQYVLSNIWGKSSSQKFNFIHKFIVFNPFMNEDMKNVYMISVCRYQRLVMAVNMIKNKRKQRQLHKNTVTTDLYLTPLDSISCTDKIDVVENNAEYTFTLKDCFHLIHNSLCNNSFFFFEPINPRNPYTNLEFSFLNISKICIALKTNGLCNSLILSYMECYYCLTQFKRYNLLKLRENAIRSYIKEMNLNCKVFKLKEMFFAYCGKKLKSLKTDDEKHKLVNRLKHEMYLEHLNLYKEFHGAVFAYYLNIHKRLTAFYYENIHLFTN